MVWTWLCVGSLLHEIAVGSVGVFQGVGQGPNATLPAMEGSWKNEILKWFFVRYLVGIRYLTVRVTT